jgi:hypothetical protein
LHDWRYVRKPKPRINIAQVEGSGTAEANGFESRLKKRMSPVGPPAVWGTARQSKAFIAVNWPKRWFLLINPGQGNCTFILLVAVSPT